MSAFLGRIHYWLYNKIQLHEDLLEEVLKLAERKNVDTKAMISESYKKYGTPERRSLEEAINHGNIHGWLQEKIQSVEYRTAAIVTELTTVKGITIKEIADIYYENGIKTMKNMVLEDHSLQNMYTLIFDFMLEGMPCDNINKLISSSEDELVWQTTRDLHKEYWDKVHGKVSDFYILRDAWINGFLKYSGKDYSYSRTDEGINRISSRI